MHHIEPLTSFEPESHHEYGKWSPYRHEDEPYLEKPVAKAVEKKIEKVIDEQKSMTKKERKEKKKERQERREERGEDRPLASIIPESAKKKLEKRKETYAEKTFMKGVRQMFFLNLSTEEEYHPHGDDSYYEYSHDLYLQ